MVAELNAVRLALAGQVTAPTFQLPKRGTWKPAPRTAPAGMVAPPGTVAPAAYLTTPLMVIAAVVTNDPPTRGSDTCDVSVSVAGVVAPLASVPPLTCTG